MYSLGVAGCSRPVALGSNFSISSISLVDLTRRHPRLRGSTIRIRTLQLKARRLRRPCQMLRISRRSDRTRYEITKGGMIRESLFRAYGPACPGPEAPPSVPRSSTDALPHVVQPVASPARCSARSPTGPIAPARSTLFAYGRRELPLAAPGLEVTLDLLVGNHPPRVSVADPLVDSSQLRFLLVDVALQRFCRQSGAVTGRRPGQPLEPVFQFDGNTHSQDRRSGLCGSFDFHIHICKTGALTDQAG